MTIQDKMLEYADELVSGGFRYIYYNRQKKCPVCGGGKEFGGNCILFVCMCMKHGGGIDIRCSARGIISDLFGYILYKSPHKLRLWELRNGSRGHWKIIWNNGNPIPSGMLKKGDICFCYKNSRYFHSVLYRGDGRISDCSIEHGKAMTRDYTSLPNPVKIAVRWKD